MRVELDIAKVVLERIRMLRDSHWIILLSFAMFCMFCMFIIPSLF